MIRALATLACASVAAGFLTAPPAAQRTSALSMANKDFAAGLPGTSLPFADGFDPIGLSQDKEVTVLKKFQESELKHGRICMLAAAGILLQENFHPFFDGKITGPATGHFQQLLDLQGPKDLFLLPVIALIGAVEFIDIAAVWEQPEQTKAERIANIREDATPGDLKFDPLGLKPGSAAGFDAMRTKELNNGRLAMIGTAGMIAQELVDHRPILEHLSLFGFNPAS